MNAMLLATPDTLRQAADHLSAQDPVLQPLIKRMGLSDYAPHRDYYNALVSSIIGQQLSVKAAASIRRRFLELFGGEFPEPAMILEKSTEALRSAGLSGAKAAYIQDLARHVASGKVRFDHLDALSNDEIIKELTDIKGVGEWTVHMFLMFCMGRLDVLPVGDLGIKNGMRALYGLKDIPTPDKIVKIAKKNHWHPYESVASWYVWEFLDNKPKA